LPHTQVFILDIDLPEMDGYALARWLSSYRATLYIGSLGASVTQQKRYFWLGRGEGTTLGTPNR
jgi:CheY-like chemotaxis protein